MDIDAKLNTST